jgi:hypothetical protein
MTLDNYFNTAMSIVASFLPKYFFEDNEQRIDSIIFESYSFGELPDEAASQVLNFYEKSIDH